MLKPAYLQRLDIGPPLHAVRQAIDDGEHWVLAWNRHTDVIYRHLARDSRIEEGRMAAIERGEVPTVAELDLLAKVWRVPVDAIRQTLPFSVLA